MITPSRIASSVLFSSLFTVLTAASLSCSRPESAGGTGLGLAIVKHIAQVHGGSVQVKSKVGAGSEFVIVLPGGGEQ